MFTRRLRGMPSLNLPNFIEVSGSLSLYSYKKQVSLEMHHTIINLQKRFYDKKVIDHYENPKNVGSFNKKDQNVGTGLVGSPACGDLMKLQIKVDENDKIIDTKIKVFGCASAISSSSFSSEMIKNMKVDDAVKITNKEIASALSLPPVKLHCSMLAEDAIKAAVDDYKKKKKDFKVDTKSGC